MQVARGLLNKEHISSHGGGRLRLGIYIFTALNSLGANESQPNGKMGRNQPSFDGSAHACGTFVNGKCQERQNSSALVMVHENTSGI
jgi:hypothetical protein